MCMTKRLLLVALAFMMPTVGRAQTILKYTDHEPLGGMRTRFIQDVLFPAIEKESKGRLKVDAHWDGEIGTGYQALGKIGKERAADMGIVVPEYAPKELPLQQLFKSFPVGPVESKQLSFFRRAYAEVAAFPAELEKENVVPLFFATGFPVAFFSALPLDTLKDIKGETWRSASFWHQGFLKNAGATPVSMPWGTETFNALRAKTLDGLMVNVDSGYALKAHELAPNVLLSKSLWLGHVYILVMNRDTWGGLAKEDQQAIQRAAKKAYKVLGTLMESSWNTQIEALKNGGARVRVLSQGEVTRWERATKYRELQTAWVKEQEEKGLKGAAVALKKVRELLNSAMR